MGQFNGRFVAMGLGLVVAAFAATPAHAAPCRPLDVTPPTTPIGGFRVDGTAWSLTWSPSTDDTRVVGYEIFGNDGVSATTTSTSIPLGNTPPSTGATHAIRAVDAAGNASPAMIATFRFDISAPSAPTNLRISGPARGFLQVGWDASRDDIAVKGYEVYLNDTLVRNVGNTKAYVPYSGYGIYRVSVRAYDMMNRFSPATELSLAIDPPPTGRSNV
ncbi:hypothetical protein ACTMTJ_00570 [Phytohabitans sp. LJ34]|uniref:hypothetical protein n=1 Tax=Phytohabitans sp. LJ34 TaxID=3452217 RepID=UPI003F88FD58